MKNRPFSPLGQECQPEQALLASRPDEPGDVEERPLGELAVTHDPDATGLFDDEQRRRVVGPPRDVDRVLQPGNERLDRQAGRAVAGRTAARRGARREAAVDGAALVGAADASGDADAEVAGEADGAGEGVGLLQPVTAIRTRSTGRTRRPIRRC